MSTIIGYTFGNNYQLYLDPPHLAQNGQHVHLTSRPLNILIYLVINRRHIVTLGDILDDVIGKQGGRSEQNIKAHIVVIRKAIEHTNQTPIISTFPNKGYKFVAAVRKIERTLSAASNLLEGVRGLEAAKQIDDMRRDYFRTSTPPTHQQSGIDYQSGKLINLLEQFNAAELARVNAKLYEFLDAERSARDPLYLQSASKMMHIEVPLGMTTLTIPIPVAVLTDVAHIKLSSPPDLSSDNSLPAAEDEEFVRQLKLINAYMHPLDPDKYFYNNPTYTLQELSISDTACTLFGSISDYFSMLATHDSMEFELLSAFGSGAGDTGGNVLDCLPRRRQFFSLTTAQKRQQAALGITTILVYKTKRGGYKIMVRKRSDDVAVYRGLFHSIPSGMFQYELDAVEEWSIQHCIIKEYSEELFNKVTDKAATTPHYIYSQWECAQDFYAALETGQCKILHSGMLLNLLNCRPQICCAILIEDAEWYESQRRKQRTNWEFLPLGEIVRTDKQAFTELDLDDLEGQLAIPARQSIGPNSAAMSIVSKWIPDGLASLWMGAAAVREHLYEPSARPAIFEPL